MIAERPTDREIRAFLYHVGRPATATRYPGYNQTIAWLERISSYTDQLAGQESDEDDDRRNALESR